MSCNNPTEQLKGANKINILHKELFILFQNNKCKPSEYLYCARTV